MSKAWRTDWRFIMKNLTKGSPAKAIILFAIPVIIGNLLQLTYSLIDTRIVGQYLGEDALAAVGATSSLSTLVIGFVNGLGNGFAVIVARYFGAGEKRGIQRAVAGSFSLAASIAVLLTLFTIILLNPILKFLNTPKEIFGLSYQYIFIIFTGISITMLYNVSSAILRAIGDTVTPLIFLGCSTILNIFGDIFCICVLNLGVRGAAISTVASQLLAAAACMVYMFVRYDILHFHMHDVLFRLRPWPKSSKKHSKIEKRANTNIRLLLDLLGCGLSMGLMGCLVNIGSVALQTGINSLGDEFITAHMAARKLTELYMVMFSVLGSTMATYSSQNYGAGRYDRIRTGMWRALQISWIWCLVVLACSFTPVCPILIRAVTATDNPVIIDNAVLYLKINTCLYFVAAAICILRNVMQGIGDHITPIVSSFIECIGKIIIVILLVPLLGYTGIILSEPVVWVLMVIPLLVQIIKNPVMKG